jgi:hypothetical protein
MRLLQIVLLTLSLAVSQVLSPAAVAQQSCDLDETVIGCWDRLQHSLAPATIPVAKGAPADIAAAEAVVAEAGQVQELKAEPVGQDTGDTSLQSVTKGFLPLAALSALLGQGEGVDDEGNIVFDLNFLLPGGLGGKNAQLQAVATTKPQIAKGVESKLPEATRSEQLEALKKQLSTGDDVLFSFSFNLQGLNRGRNFEIYRRRYQSLVSTARKNFVKQLESATFPNKLAEVVETCPPAFPADSEPAEVTFAQIEEACGGPAAARVRRAIAASASGFGDALAAFRSDLEGSGLHRFAELVANQPQLYVSAKYRDRNALAGGRVTAGKIAYEWARVNLASAMNEDCHRRLDAADVDDAALGDCITQYKNYVAGNAGAIADGERFSFSFEYERVNSAVVPLSPLLPGASPADIKLEGAKKRIGSLGWSRKLAGPGQEPMRLDVVASYEDITDDPQRRDRFVATATVTRNAAGFVIPLGIVYANHSEFLGDVDHKLSAHVGLKFSLDGVAK